MKKNIIVPLVVFLAGMCLLSGILCGVYENERDGKVERAQLNAMTHAEQMKNDIANGIEVTNTLQQILISEEGHINHFDTVAEHLLSDSIQSIQIAPGGVVTDIYPAKGNEAGKIDLIHDKDRGEISRYARDHHVVTIQGPFQLNQGGYGVAVRNPAYIEDAAGQEKFWGFTIVILRVPDIFADSMNALTNFGYEYRLSKTKSPWEDVYEDVYQSGGNIDPLVSYAFEAGGAKWRLEVMPKNGWGSSTLLILMGVIGAVLVLLLTGITRALLILNENKNKFRLLAITDNLTGIYNRQGFEDFANRQIRQNKEEHFIAAELDIDDFKLINDIYGHAAGDCALISLVKSMEAYFPKDAVLGRNGGDEFCIFLRNHSFEEAKEKFLRFTKQPKTFLYDGKEHEFSISLGFAEYPVFGKNLAETLKFADDALYEVKLHGKNGCMAYREGLRLEKRHQLGFVLSDISQNLPGAFIIYRADRENDEILYANSELLYLLGCKNMDEMMAYTKKSFRNLIREDEQQRMENSIWEQINRGQSNDYIHFHMKRADGTYLPVLDHGRIVESERYGKVFYVLFLDREAMKRHYGDMNEKIPESDEKFIAE